MDARDVLLRAAALSCCYDRNAKAEVRLNATDAFHICGLIERAASLPKSGSTHRRTMGGPVIDQAKAAFCRANGVPHPSVWEWEERRSCENVRQALALAANAL